MEDLEATNDVNLNTVTSNIDLNTIQIAQPRQNRYKKIPIFHKQPLSTIIEREVSSVENACDIVKDDFEDEKSVATIKLLNSNHNVRWNWHQFFEFLLYHFIFFFLLGPFITLLLRCKPGLVLLKNMEFRGFSVVCFIQTFIFITNFYCSVSFFMDYSMTIKVSEMIYLWALILNLCLIISSKYATFSTSMIQVYKTMCIDIDIKRKLQYMHFYTPQSAEARYAELSASFKRQEFEPSLFYVSFFNAQDPYILLKLHECTQQLRSYHSNKSEQYQPEPLIPSEQQFYGFGIINKLIQSFEDQSPWKLLITYSWLLSLTIALMPILYDCLKGAFDGDGVRIFYVIFMIFTETYCGFVSIIFLLTSLRDIKKKRFLLRQCDLIISPAALNDEEKRLPSINITEVQNIMAWSMLRKICLDYGKQYTIRAQAFYSFIIFYCVFVTIFVALNFLKVIEIDQFSIIYLLASDIIFFVLILSILIESAHLNQSFNVYQDLIKDWIKIILDIQRMRNYYFTKELVPVNNLHRKIVDCIMEQIDTESIDKVEQYLNSIKITFEDSLRHLDYDKRKDSCRYYGYEITFKALWLTFGIISIVVSNVVYWSLHNQNY